MTAPINTLLIIEDNSGDARLLREMLHVEGSTRDTDLVYATSMAEAEKLLSKRAFDIILLDLGLPDANGLAAIRRARSAAPGIPLVVLTGMEDEQLSKRSLKEGAQDYLIKGQIDSRSLLRALRYAAERKRLERLKDEFVSTVSHELRTPLTSITASLGLLVNRVTEKLPPAEGRLVKIAYANSQRLVRLVNDILDIERLESGKVVFDLRRVGSIALVDAAVEANRGFAESHHVRLRVEGSSEAIPDVRADYDRLFQVMTNLLSNAIKFSPFEAEVVIAVTNNDGMVRVSVRDHGSGIAENFKSHIFERFAQADATNTRQKGGTGLGLSIVKQIMDRLGGRASFNEAPGGGTAFFFELPSWEGDHDLAHLQRVESTAKAEADGSFEGFVDAAKNRLPVIDDAPHRQAV